MKLTLRPLLPLAMLALAAAIGLEAARHGLAARIEAGRQRAAMEPVMEVMPLAYDNDLLADRATLEGLDQPLPATVYRARASGHPVGVVIAPVVARGYNAGIELAVGIAYDGVLTGVRIVRHRETPGLGDQVDQRQTRWADQFPGRSLADTPAEQWAVTADGGRFDAIAGATITPRGIVRAVHGVLERYHAGPDTFYE